MNQKRVVIIHGTEGSPEGNWLPWLAAKVRETGQPVTVPTLPTPEGQNLKNWEAAFADQVGQLTSDMILVGHSIGAGFILRLLEKSDQPIAASFLVSGFTSTLGSDFFDPLIESFFHRPFDWQKIKRNAGKAFVYHGNDDPYVPISHAETIAAHLGVKPVLIPKGGHLSEGAGFTELPRLWTDLGPLLDTKAPLK